MRIYKLRQPEPVLFVSASEGLRPSRLAVTLWLTTALILATLAVYFSK